MDGGVVTVPLLTSIISAVGPTVAGAASAVSATSPYLLAGSAGLSAYGQYQSGQAQKDVAKFDAERAKIAATDERIARNEKLLRSMAARTAGAGARGVTLGSILPAQNEDIRQTQLGQASADATLGGQVSTLRARGKNAATAGKIAAGATLMNAIGTMSSI